MSKKMFISYSHKDEVFREELEVQLSTLKRNGDVDTWSDRKIIAGQEWDGEIKKGLEEANIILLLISPDFLASDYCYDIEIKRAIEKHNAKETVVVPIFLRYCDWQDTPFAKIQGLPSNGEPVSSWADRDKGFLDIVKGLKKILVQQTIRNENSIELCIKEGDVFDNQSDVLALKYAQGFYGVDFLVSNRLKDVADYSETEIVSPIGEYKFLLTRGVLKTPFILFLGVCNLYDFGYSEIKTFSFDVLKILSKQNIDIKNLSLTIHGVGYGLDELEAFLSELAGIKDAINIGLFPKILERITIIENDPQRVVRLKQYLSLAGNSLGYEKKQDNIWSISVKSEISINKKDIEATYKNYAKSKESNKKDYVFVAMPFKKDFDDVYYFGIQGAVHENNLLCERIDQEIFNGDVLKQILKKIENAKMIIAEVTGSNPNVYLVIGYAWGHKIPIILVGKDINDVQFELREQHFLAYNRIIDLKTELSNEIKSIE